MKIFFLLLFTLICLKADNEYSLRIAYGKATMSDFSEIMVGNWQGHPKDLYVASFDGGYLLKKEYDGMPLDIYAKAGYSHYDEDGMRPNRHEINAYIKLYWSFESLDRAVRFGFGEGFSYTSAILYTEWLEATQEKDTNSKFLNYLDVSLDMNLGKITAHKALEGVYVGWALKHRSGIFGLINNVRRGGSNYNTFYVEITF